ncbi:MAG: carbohydrate binding domain-containing protein, partial [Candidatus Theseobacter exili]|nr:carbohydrate binding domain-containing protein [Candidatus Theseobacter exili]
MMNKNCLKMAGALVVGLFLLSGSIYAAENLIKNGDFEMFDTGGKDLPTYWYITGEKSGVSCVSYEKTGGKVGEKCIKIENPPQKGVALRQRYLYLSTSQQYKLSAYFKTENFTGNAQIIIKNSDWSWNAGSIQPPSSTTDWVLKENTFTPKPSPNREYTVLLYMSKGCSGKIWVDGVKLEPVGVALEPVAAAQKPVVAVPSQYPKVRESFLGTPVSIEKQDSFLRVKFLASKNKAGFTKFSGVKDIKVKNGKLSFVLAKDKATLTWSNSEGKSPRFNLIKYPLKISVNLSLKESEQCVWTVAYRNPTLNKTYGKSVEGIFSKSTSILSFSPWVTSRREYFYSSSHNILPAGTGTEGSLEFVIKGKKGTRVEIDCVELSAPIYKVYTRYEFELPEGKIWRAVTDVNKGCCGWFPACGKTSTRSCCLYVNGRKIDLPETNVWDRQRGYAIDIRSYLKPGRNCVGFYLDQFHQAPFLYFQSKIVMDSGKVIEVASGPEWRYSFNAGKGWSSPGFDDSEWEVSKKKIGRARDWFPAYQGRLVLANPSGGELFYIEDKNTIIDVKIPVGLKHIKPVVSYKFGRCDGDKIEDIQKGKIDTYRIDGNNLVFGLDLGALKGGVYVVAIDMLAQEGKTIESRSWEPFIVIPKNRGKIITGKSYMEGMDTQLEDVIDFTDPNDPHPNFESCPVKGEIKKPVIVKKNGLHYREVASWHRSAGFSYRIQFKHPGSFYVMELEYPDDAKRIIEVIVNGKSKKFKGTSHCSFRSAAGAETGGRHLPTNKMRKLYWLHLADHGVNSVDIVNHRDFEKCAAKSLRIYLVKGPLPQLKMGNNRKFGHYTERTIYACGIGRFFGLDSEQRGRGHFDLGPAYDGPVSMNRRVRTLQWWYETYSRYIQYMNFCGRNFHVMGCYQYTHDNTPISLAQHYQKSRISDGPRRLLAQFMNKNNIDFYSEVEWSYPPPFKDDVTDKQVAEGADTARMINGDGKQLFIYNWLHPEVREKYYTLIRELAHTFGDLKSYKGMHTALNPRACVWNIPGFSTPHGKNHINFLYSSYDDITFREFERETGVKTGISFKDRARFRKRAEFIEENIAARKRFIVWRGRKLTKFYSGVIEIIRKKRADLDLALLPETGLFSPGNNIPVIFEELLEKDISLDRYLKDFGINVEALNSVPGIFFGR